MLTSVNPSPFETEAEIGEEIEPTMLLSREQEQLLAYQIRQGGAVGEIARTRFIEANIRLVFKIALHYKHARGTLEYDDLVQEGRIGLIHAVDTFEPEQGCKFSTYAVRLIHQAIMKALNEKRSTIRVPNYRWTALRKMQRAEQLLIQRHRRLPSAEELAEEAEITVEMVETLCDLCNVLDLCSLDKSLRPGSEEELTLCPGSEEELTLGDLLFSSDDNTEERALANAFSVMLRSVLEEILPPRERQVLVLLFGFNGHEHTLEEVARKLKVSRERIRQIEQQALRKLRRPPVLAKLSA